MRSLRFVLIAAGFVALVGPTIPCADAQPSISIGVRNYGGERPITCTAGSVTFTVPMGSVEYRALRVNEPTIRCNGQAVTLDASRTHHYVECAGGTGFGDCREVSTNPPPVFAIRNLLPAEMQCNFGNEWVSAGASLTVSWSLAFRSPGQCRLGSTGTPFDVTLAPGVVQHTIVCSADRKGRADCADSANPAPAPTPAPAPAPPPPPPRGPTAASPRVVSEAPYPIQCSGTMSDRNGAISVSTNTTVAFPFDDVKPAALTVTCWRSDWKRNPPVTVVLPNPHQVPSVVKCVKANTAAFIACSAQ